MHKEKQNTKNERKMRYLIALQKLKETFFCLLEMATFVHETPNCFNDARTADDDAVKSYR